MFRQAASKFLFLPSLHSASKSKKDRQTQEVAGHEKESPEDDILVLGGLGLGGYGTVVEVAASGVNIRLAMKCMSKARISSRQNLRSQIAHEIHVLTTAEPSPFLLRCHLAFETDSAVFLVSDLLSGGDLFFRLEHLFEQEGRDGFVEEEGRIILAEVAMGLCHLHRRGFVHRDIKVENVMFSGDGHVKLVDFGIVVELPDGGDQNGDGPAEISMDTTGSLIYMAPELLKKRIGGRFTDWWAFGILSYEVLTGHCPWSTLSDNRQIHREIINVTVCAPHCVSDAAGDFLTSLLRPNHRIRMGTHNDREVFSSPFLSGIDFDDLQEGKTAPAFVPQRGESPVDDTDAAAALDKYREITAAPAPSPSFSFGLLRVSEPPSEALSAVARLRGVAE